MSSCGVQKATLCVMLQLYVGVDACSIIRFIRDMQQDPSLQGIMSEEDIVAVTRQYVNCLNDQMAGNLDAKAFLVTGMNKCFFTRI